MHPCFAPLLSEAVLPRVSTPGHTAVSCMLRVLQACTMLWRTDLPGLSSSSRQLLTPCCCCRDRAWPTMSAADSLVGGFCRPQHRTAQRHQQRLPATGRIQSRSLSTSQSDNQRPTVSLQHQRTGLSDWDVKDAATSSTVASAVANAERVSSHAKASTSGARQPR